MTVDRKPEASLKSSVDDPHEIALAGLEFDVVSVWDDCSIDILARKAIDIASAVENDAGVFEPDLRVCCCRGWTVKRLQQLACSVQESQAPHKDRAK
jgi:hypothetical protein